MPAQPSTPATSSPEDSREPAGVPLVCDLCESPERTFFAHSPEGNYFTCNGCGLVYGVSDSDELPSFYDTAYTTRHSPRIERGIHDRAQRSKRWHAKADKRLEDCEAYRQTGNFLEVGCSLGDFLNIARVAGWNAIGVEISPTAVEYARQKWGLDVRSGTLESVYDQLEPESFDVIWAANLLEHVVSPREFLQVVEKLLRPGGVLIASTLNFASWAFRLSGPKWEYLHSAKQHRFVFSPKLLDRYCEIAGLKPHKIETVGFRCISKGGDRHWYSPAVRFFEQGIAKLAQLTNRGHRITLWAQKPERSQVILPMSTGDAGAPRRRKAA